MLFIAYYAKYYAGIIDASLISYAASYRVAIWKSQLVIYLSYIITFVRWPIKIVRNCDTFSTSSSPFFQNLL